MPEYILFLCSLTSDFNFIYISTMTSSKCFVFSWLVLVQTSFTLTKWIEPGSPKLMMPILLPLISLQSAYYIFIYLELLFSQYSAISFFKKIECNIYTDMIQLTSYSIFSYALVAQIIICLGGFQRRSREKE